MLVPFRSTYFLDMVGSTQHVRFTDSDYAWGIFKLFLLKQVKVYNSGTVHLQLFARKCSEKKPSSDTHKRQNTWKPNDLKVYDSYAALELAVCITTFTTSPHSTKLYIKVPRVLSSRRFSLSVAFIYMFVLSYIYELSFTFFKYFKQNTTTFLFLRFISVYYTYPYIVWQYLL